MPLFDLNDHGRLGRMESPRWNERVFELAYGAECGTFDRDVISKLRAGFSVLVYLPGNCMKAVADLIRNKDKVEGAEWKDIGVDSGQKGLDAWKPGGGYVQQILEWQLMPKGGRPHAFFHNLDLLSTSGALVGHREALEAVTALAEASRAGVVLGLADREAGALPAEIERHFRDKVWLREIDLEGFCKIIPVTMESVFGTSAEPTDGRAWKLHTRLRWCDPIRAVKILHHAALNCGDLPGILTEIYRQTRPPGYTDPSALPGAAGKSPSGFYPVLIRDLQAKIIDSYSAWSTFDSTSSTVYDQELHRLFKGVILWGQPGTGKTTLARWIAKCIGLPIRIVSASEIKMSRFGDAERTMHNLFLDARRAAPCVLVFDDADDIFPKRSQLQGSVASAELGIVNAALQELEGVYGPLTGVLVILTTNLKDSIDKAFIDRLGFIEQVPCPLDQTQLGEVVDTCASELGLNLVAGVRNSLLTHFMDYVNPNLPNKKLNVTAADRLACSENLYSPRKIAMAMRYLRGSSAGSYTPTNADFVSMKEFCTRTII